MLGDLSKLHESNGDPATVSSGLDDYGGVSYGAYQFSSVYGIVQDFVSWLQYHATLQWARDYGNSLAHYQVNSEEFKAQWKELGTLDSTGFLALQYEYTKEKYFDASVSILKGHGFNAEKHSEALRQALWSRAVQYDSGNILEMFESALQYVPGYDSSWNLSYVDDKRFDWDLINGLYSTCMTWEWNHGPSMDSLNKRFVEERRQVWDMLAVEK